MSGVHPDNLDPSQLSFYTPTTHDIIKHAKQIFHCDIAFHNSFPLHPQVNTKAGKYMNKAIVKCWSQGLIIPDVSTIIIVWPDTDHYQGGGLNIQMMSSSLFIFKLSCCFLY